jgi:hypothetical protein
LATRALAANANSRRPAKITGPENQHLKTCWQNYLADQYGDCLCFSCMKAKQQAFTLKKFNNKMKRLLRMDNYPIE